MKKFKVQRSLHLQYFPPLLSFLSNFSLSLFSYFLIFFFYTNPAVLIAAKYSAIQYGVILLLGVVKRAVAHISEHPPLMVPSAVTRLSHAAHIVKIIKLIKKIIQ